MSKWCIKWEKMRTKLFDAKKWLNEKETKRDKMRQKYHEEVEDLLGLCCAPSLDCWDNLLTSLLVEWTPVPVVGATWIGSDFSFDLFCMRCRHKSYWSSTK
jgi:hypothetical protein